jgi:hypothetical protein
VGRSETAGRFYREKGKGEPYGQGIDPAESDIDELRVFAAVVAGDDLAGGRRIGKDLQSSSVEAHFSEGLAEGAEARPPDDRAVLQDQHGLPGCLIAGRDQCRLWDRAS